MKTKREIGARLTELHDELTQLMQQNPEPDNGWLRKILRLQTSIGVLEWVLREGLDQPMTTTSPPVDTGAKI